MVRNHGVGITFLNQSKINGNDQRLDYFVYGNQSNYLKSVTAIMSINVPTTSCIRQLITEQLRTVSLVLVHSLLQYCCALTVSGDPDLKWFFARMKIWQSETEVCHGQWVRFICNLGIGDIARVKTAQQLFVNKIRLEQDPLAFRCLELWYQNRLRASAEDRVFNVTFYANLPFALNHV